MSRPKLAACAPFAALLAVALLSGSCTEDGGLAPPEAERAAPTEAAAEVAAGSRCNYTASAHHLDPRAGNRAPGRRVGNGAGDGVSLASELPGEEEEEHGPDR